MVRTLLTLAFALGLCATASAGKPAKKTDKKADAKAALFAKADTDKDGKLSKAEFEKFLAEAKAKKPKAK